RALEHGSVSRRLFRPDKYVGARFLPQNDRHAKKIVAKDFQSGCLLRGKRGRKYSPDLIRNIRPAHRCQAVDSRNVRAHERKTGIDQGKVQGMPNQIIDQHGATADSQRIAYEVYQLGWIKVVRKQIAADQVKSCIAERE